MPGWSAREGEALDAGGDGAAAGLSLTAAAARCRERCALPHPEQNLHAHVVVTADVALEPAGTGVNAGGRRLRPPAWVAQGDGVRTFAAPRVTVVVKRQSAAASFVSVPFGMRLSEPSAVFESATSVGSTVPSTSE
jgi:hypothetical protein